MKINIHRIINNAFKPVETFLAKPEALEPYTVILIASTIDPIIFSNLAEHSAKNSIPLFSIHSVGFYSQFSVQLPSVFPIVDTHPDPASATDLRILKPWRDLQDLAERMTKDCGNLSDDDHSHIPYVLLLLHYVGIWKSKNEGRLPQTYKEKSELRDMIRKDERHGNADAGEENYQEAVAAVLKSLNSPSLGSGVREIFEAEECRNITSKVRKLHLRRSVERGVYQMIATVVCNINYCRVQISGSLQMPSTNFTRLTERFPFLDLCPICELVQLIILRFKMSIKPKRVLI